MAVLRAMIVQAANVVGFPAPLPTQGLTAWADEALDTTLTRGSPPWQQAHAHVLDALQAATVGDESGVRAALAHARDRACADGRRGCACALEARGQRVAVRGRVTCAKCGGRG